MKKSIPIIRERESEAFILGNGREREFPLTPALNMEMAMMAGVPMVSMRMMVMIKTQANIIRNNIRIKAKSKIRQG